MTVEAPKRPKFPEFPPTPEPVVKTAPEPVLAVVVEAGSGSDWPEPEPASSGAPTGAGEGSKRKRRRKKGKGGGQGPRNEVDPQAEGPSTDEGDDEEPAAPAPRQSQPPQQPQVSRVRIDPEQLAKFAWKIYLGEVGEEGIALIGDQDAKELSRRCFRLAEIFLEEQARRR